MHISFIPYGRRCLVEGLLRDMEAQKTFIRMRKDGSPESGMWVTAQVRQLPFGIYEYICAKEDRDVVLNTLNPGHHDDYIPLEFKIFGFNIDVMEILRKMTHSNPIPTDYKKDQKYMWIRDNVDITLIGIKDDPDIFCDKGGIDQGWTHEAI